VPARTRHARLADFHLDFCPTLGSQYRVMRIAIARAAQPWDRDQDQECGVGKLSRRQPHHSAKPVLPATADPTHRTGLFSSALDRGAARPQPCRPSQSEACSQLVTPDQPMPPSYTGSFVSEEVRAYTSVCHTLDNSDVGTRQTCSDSRRTGGVTITPLRADNSVAMG
jgi:hypothetical protein